MANISERHTTNATGRFYVDASCIDCDQCRVDGPDFFARDDDAGSSFVVKQPVTDDEIALVEQIANACPTGSIGDDGV